MLITEMKKVGNIVFKWVVKS